MAVEAERRIGDPLSAETLRYSSSLPPDVTTLNPAVRSHGRIEDRLHWILDITFHEDAPFLARTDHAPQSFAVLRDFALDLLR